MVMKNKQFLGLLICGMLFSGQAFSRAVGRGTVPNTNPSNSSPTTTHRDNGTPSTSSSGGGCKPSKENNYVSLEFLKTVAFYPSEITAVSSGNDKLVVNLPKYISACLDVKFEAEIISNVVFLRMKNISTELDSSTAGESKTMSEKYFACLEGKGYITGEGQIDYAKAETEGAINYGGPETINIDMGEMDESKYLVFGSTRVTDYPHSNKNERLKKSPSSWNCMVYEDFSKKDHSYSIFTSAEDAAERNVRNVCASEDYETMLQELSKLRSSSLGNAAALREYLEDNIEAVRSIEAKKIYEKLDEIEKSFADARKEGDFLSAEISEEKSELYVEYLRKLNRVVLQPSISKLDELIKSRTDENKTEVDKKIKALNENIGLYAKKTPKDLGPIVEHMKKYALTDEGAAMEGVRLTSLNYRSVYKSRKDSRGQPQSMSDAAKSIKKKHAIFEKEILTDWSFDYSTRNGNKLPIISAKRDIQRTKASMLRIARDFQKKEQKNGKKSCGRSFTGGVKNPIACKRFMAGRSRRQKMFSNQLKRMELKNRGKSERLARYTSNYETYLDTVEEEGTDDDPFGYYTSSFSDLYSVGDDYSDYELDFNSNDSSDFFNMGTRRQSQGQSQYGNPFANRGPAQQQWGQPQQQWGQPQQMGWGQQQNISGPGGNFFNGGNPYARPF